MIRPFEEVILKNVVLDDDYGIACQPYEYLFFRIPENIYPALKEIQLDIRVASKKALLVINEYRGTTPFLISGQQKITIPIESCEAGENILAYKGQIRIQSISWEPVSAQDTSADEPQDSIKMAAEFLLNSRVPSTLKNTRFEGSCFAIYDYTNECHRMPCWLWSDAPAVSAALEIIRTDVYPEKKRELEKLALSIGEVFLRNQIADPQNECFGALVSRFRYYGKTDRSFHCLLGMNDTSYSVKWALLPLYEYTKDERYLNASLQALKWVEKNIYSMDFVPSHYYLDNRVWEGRAFVDTGFCADGFAKYQEVTKSDIFKNTISFVMDRFLKQFSLGNGFYGQNYIPGNGVDNRLFTRGHAWVLEGLLACMKSVDKPKYQKKANELIHLLMEIQKPDGSFSYLLGYGEPAKPELDHSGVCEKATAILAFLFLDYCRIVPDTAITNAANRALSWCKANMNREHGPGFGGIHAASLSSGITGLPYLDVATGYGNAYFILAQLLKRDFES